VPFSLQYARTRRKDRERFSLPPDSLRSYARTRKIVAAAAAPWPMLVPPAPQPASWSPRRRPHQQIRRSHLLVSIFPSLDLQAMANRWTWLPPLPAPARRRPRCRLQCQIRCRRLVLVAVPEALPLPWCSVHTLSPSGRRCCYLGAACCYLETNAQVHFLLASTYVNLCSKYKVLVVHT